jgi:hypothetical protein
MNMKRPEVATALFLSFILVASGALSAPIGQAHAQTAASAGRPGLAQEQAHSDRSGSKPSPDKLHLASLSNGGFEAGPGVAWTEYSAVALGRSLIVDAATLSPNGVTPHSGSWAAWLGGIDDETAYISQTVDVPASHPILSFWEWINSLDYCPSDGDRYDYGSILINNTEVTYFDLCTDTATGGWVESTLDLSAYAGQTVQLQIRATIDSSFTSSLFIDDVALEGQTSNHSVYLPLLGTDFCSSYEYFDGFGDPNSGWYPGVDGDVTHEYVNSEYQLRFDNFDQGWYVTPDLVIPTSNYRVEADMRNAGNNPGTYGLVFGVHWNGSNGADQGYQVLLNPNPDFQEYQIMKITSGDWPTLRNWTYSGAIHTDPATNHLRVDRVGTAIRVYINGTAMPALTDTSYTGSGRDAGITAYSYDSYPVDMRFDNFHASGCPQ